MASNGNPTKYLHPGQSPDFSLEDHARCLQNSAGGHAVETSWLQVLHQTNQCCKHGDTLS